METDVFAAVRKGDLERLRALVEQDAALVHAVDDDGETPLLHVAYKLGRRGVDVVRYLLDHGAAVNHRDHSRSTPLHAACRRGSTGVVFLLLQRGADVTAVNDYGNTPLMSAAIKGCDDIVRVLLEHGGSDVDAANPHGWTACHWACGHGLPGVLRQLLEAGANPTLRETYSRHTAIEVAAEHDRQECVTILQEWERAYLLQKLRRMRDATSAASSIAL